MNEKEFINCIRKCFEYRDTANDPAKCMEGARYCDKFAKQAFTDANIKWGVAAKVCDDMREIARKLRKRAAELSKAMQDTSIHLVTPAT